MSDNIALCIGYFYISISILCFISFKIKSNISKKLDLKYLEKMRLILLNPVTSEVFSYKGRAFKVVTNDFLTGLSGYDASVINNDILVKIMEFLEEKEYLNTKNKCCIGKTRILKYIAEMLKSYAKRHNGLCIINNSLSNYNGYPVIFKINNTKKNIYYLATL